MAFDVVMAKRLSKEMSLKGAFRISETVDMFSFMLDQHAIDGHQITPQLINQMPAAKVFGENESSITSDELLEVMTDPPSLKFYRFGGEFTINSLVADTYSSIQDLRQLQIDALKQSIYELICNKYINGSTEDIPPSFDGLPALCYNQIGANDDAENGGQLLITDMDRLMSKIEAAPVPDYFVASQKGIEQYLKACYTAGMSPQTITISGMNRPIMAHRGIPILRDDWISNGETKGTGTDLTSIYAVVLGWQRGLCGIYPASLPGARVDRFVMSGSDNEVFRVTVTCGLVLFKIGALALVNGIETT